MKFYLSIILFVFFFHSIIAFIQFKDTGELDENDKSIFKKLPPAIENELRTALVNYIRSREDVANWKITFKNPKGIVCLFTVRLDNAQNSKTDLRVLQILDESKELQVEGLNIQGPKDGFSYKYITNEMRKEVIAKLERDDGLTYHDGLQKGKQFINVHVVERLKAAGLLDGYTHTGFKAILIEGNALDNNGSGTYILIASFFSKADQQ